MSDTPRRFARLTAGLTVAAAATATALLGAAPAHAQTTSVVAEKLGATLSITGTAVGDSVDAFGGSTTITVSSTLGSVKAGNGCVQLGAVVRCTQVGLITFSGNGGDDAFRNNTSTRSRLFGGAGNDRLTGGPKDDLIRGDTGVDFAFGQGGTDSCIAENESSCELL